MTFIFLPREHHLTRREGLPDGRYYTKDQLPSSILVPYAYVPVWCPYTDNEDHVSWRNPITAETYKTHPLGLTEKDTAFFDGFYELTRFNDDLSTELKNEKQWTFGEGMAWCFETNALDVVRKTDPTSIWNPFFQRYDKQCRLHTEDCEPLRIEYDSKNEDFHSSFNGDMTQFLKVYCPCVICKFCNRVHECLYVCTEETRL